jgi:hypothetical protein
MEVKHDMAMDWLTLGCLFLHSTTDVTSVNSQHPFLVHKQAIKRASVRNTDAPRLRLGTVVDRTNASIGRAIS